MIKKNVRRVLTASMFVLMAGAGLALEMETEPETTLDTVVVTGQRAPQARSETTLAVSVMDQDELTFIGAQHVSEVLNRLPGVNLHRGNGAEHLTAIRSPVLTGGAGAGSFLYLEDGVPLRAAGFANVNGLFEAIDDLAGRVEVGRGPGSATYGSNALHGLVNVLTPDPLSVNSLVEIETGSYGRARLRAQGGGRTRFGAGLIGVSLRHEDGWRDDASMNRMAFQTRLDGEAERTRWSLRLSAVDLQQETATFVRGFEAYENKDASRLNTDPEAFRNAYALRGALHLERAFSERITGRAVVYGRSNSMEFRLHFLPSEALEETSHTSLGILSSLTWAQDRTNLAVGVDMEFTEGKLYEFQTRPTLGSFVQGVHYDYVVWSTVAAVFVQGAHQLNPRLRMESGVRLEHTRYTYDNTTANGAVGRYLRLADRNDSFTTFAPHAGLIFQISDMTALFARAARGVRAPQTAELYRLQPGQEINRINPETLDSFETGLRRGFGDRADLELTGFVMSKQNVFFRDANGINVTDGETRHHGAELEGQLRLVEWASLDGALSWAVHEYGFDRPVSNISETIVDGARIDTAPEWLSNLRLNWVLTDDVRLQAEWVHVSDHYVNAANTAKYDGHDLVNLRTNWMIADRITVFGSIRNVFDQRYAERADFAFGSYRYFPGEPRTLYVGMRLTNEVE